MAMKGGEPHLIFGTMGGESQLQVHLQLLTRIVIAGQGIAEAVAAPRWRIFPKWLSAEKGLPELGAQPYPDPSLAGHAHVIRVIAGGVEAAFDPRSDGAALGY